MKSILPRSLFLPRSPETFLVSLMALVVVEEPEAGGEGGEVGE